MNTCLPELSAASVTDELAELLSTIGDCMAKAYEDSLIPTIAFTLWNLSQDNRSTALPSADTASPTVGSSVAHHNVLPTLLSSLSKLLKSDAALTLLEPFFTRIVANVKTSSSVPQVSQCMD